MVSVGRHMAKLCHSNYSLIFCLLSLLISLCHTYSCMSLCVLFYVYCYLISKQSTCCLFMFVSNYAVYIQDIYTQQMQYSQTSKTLNNITLDLTTDQKRDIGHECLVNEYNSGESVRMRKWMCVCEFVCWGICFFLFKNLNAISHAVVYGLTVILFSVKKAFLFIHLALTHNTFVVLCTYLLKSTFILICLIWMTQHIALICAFHKTACNTCKSQSQSCMTLMGDLLTV